MRSQFSTSSQIVNLSALTNASRLLLISTLTLTASLRAGDLGDYEKSATHSHRHAEPRGRGTAAHSASDDLLEDLIGDLFDHVFVDVLDLMFVEGARMSFARVQPSYDPFYDNLGLRVRGDPDLPYLAADLGYQWVHGDVSAIDVRAEIGYGPFGAQVRDTHYDELYPRDNLDILHIEGLLRVSGSREFQVALGMGGVVIDGHEKHGGFSMTAPVGIYPWRHWGARFTPTWSWVAGNQTNEYDGSLEFVQQLYSLRIGYRTSKTGPDRLHGPYVGASYHY